MLMKVTDVYILIGICIVVGYLFGSIPTGYLFCKKYGINIFEEGSKNPGSTNVGRVLGHSAGVKVFLLDIVKTCAGIFIMILFSSFYFEYKKDLASSFMLPTETIRNLCIFYTGSGATVGHNFPFTTKFRGGKGITCTVATIAYFNIFYALILYLIHKGIGKLTKYVSVASIITLIIFFVSALLLSHFNIYPFDFPGSKYVLPAIAFMMIFGILRHASNIKRLINGTENKI